MGVIDLSTIQVGDGIMYLNNDGVTSALGLVWR
jgi:hypothetical protein